MEQQRSALLRLKKNKARSTPLAAPADFSAFYERTHLALFRYLYGLSGGPQEDVEDLTAETFTKAWRARHSFQGTEQAALGWLMKIGRCLAIDAYRRRQACPSMDDPILDEVPAPALPLEEAALGNADGQHLLSLLQGLPGETKEILVLRYLLGWPVNQIGAYLEIPENNVSATIHRALERLRRRWPEEEV